MDAAAVVEITKAEVRVRFHKRAHNPLLLAAGFGKTDVRIPWLGRKRLRLVFGEGSVGSNDHLTPGGKGYARSAYCVRRFCPRGNPG